MPPKKIKQDIQENIINDDNWCNNTYDLKCVPRYRPPITKGKVIKVYDGDTFTIVTKLYSTEPVYQFQVRINGIDTAEIKGAVDNIKKMSLLAKEKLSNLILNKVVRLENISYDKYGRILSDVYIDNIHINKWMVENHLALSYDGGHKQDSTIWNNIYETHWKTIN
jgi:endonuclease YncB( thermonuclease family)